MWVALGALGIALALSAFATGRLSAPRGGLHPRWPTVVEGGPAYKRVTYQSQTHWFARLAKDGKSVVYSRRRDGRDEVMRSLIGEPTIASTKVEGRLLDLSSRGELAVVVEPVPESGGRLFRVFEGQGPRPLSDNVTAAGWLPDGESLAIIREGLVLECPMGTRVVERKRGWLDLLRVAPSGERIAFVEHPTRGDTAGNVVVIDRAGHEIARSSDQVGIEGVAWSPDGAEVWFSNAATIRGVDMKGHERIVLRGAPARLALIDVVRSSILVAPMDIRLKMFAGPRGGPYREVSWFDSSEVDSVSRDGSSIAFVEAAGTGLTADGYALFLRTGDQMPTLFAHGYRVALLPDGSAAVVTGGPKLLTRVPTGLGTASPLALGPIDTLDTGDPVAISWQGRHAVVRGAEAQGAMKLWRIDVTSPSAPPVPVPVVHEGGRHPISPDGSLVAVANATGGGQIVSLAGAPPLDIAGPVGEEPITFSGDGTALFVRHLAGETIEIDRIELPSLVRTSWVRITPEQRPVYYSVALDATGERVTYSTNSDSSDLYVLEPP